MPFSLPQVVAVRHVGGHTLWLSFSDGLEGELDLSAHVGALRGPLLAPLGDEQLFSRVRVSAGALAWPNGADWAPEMLHRLMAETRGSHPQSDDDETLAIRRHHGGMPEISRFYGIVITMYYVDHARPHFHARHGEHSISMEIEGDGLSGSFPPNRLPLLFEWRDAHRDELTANWSRLRDGRAPLAISPLD
jgi:Domain of unknown function (DUF4160)/Protein of unknown function (DUF2442)